MYTVIVYTGAPNQPNISQPLYFCLLSTSFVPYIPQRITIGIHK